METEHTQAANAKWFDKGVLSLCYWTCFFIGLTVIGLVLLKTHIWVVTKKKKKSYWVHESMIVLEINQKAGEGLSVNQGRFFVSRT